jgi:hypothetical protein
MTVKRNRQVATIAKQIIRGIRDAASIEDPDVFQTAALYEIIRVVEKVHAKHGEEIGRALVHDAVKHVVWAGKVASEAYEAAKAASSRERGTQPA